MKRTSAELKRLSREQLNGHWGLAIGVNLLLGLITGAALMPFYFLLLISGQGGVQLVTYTVAAVIISAVSLIMQCGIFRIYLGFARKEEVTLGMMFGEFTRRPDRYILGYLLIFAIEIVCILPGLVCWGVGIAGDIVLPLLIGGVLYLAGLVVLIVVTLRFAMVYILMADHEELGVMDAFRESARLMEGNKGRFFYIYLSFIGWTLLGMFSCGIGMLWVTPYMMQVNINFYRDVTGELDQKAEPEWQMS